MAEYVTLLPTSHDGCLIGHRFAKFPTPGSIGPRKGSTSSQDAYPHARLGSRALNDPRGSSCGANPNRHFASLAIYEGQCEPSLAFRPPSRNERPRRVANWLGNGLERRIAATRQRKPESPSTAALPHNGAAGHGGPAQGRSAGFVRLGTSVAMVTPFTTKQSLNNEGTPSASSATAFSHATELSLSRGPMLGS